ncbi:hypothetical protein KFU94_00690 [Chloroflexi bacterium TSY]|nr:hypothetical protein [Chloroflexi bacterium TSY]
MRAPLLQAPRHDVWNEEKQETARAEQEHQVECAYGAEGDHPCAEVVVDQKENAERDGDDGVLGFHGCLLLFLSKTKKIFGHRFSGFSGLTSV